MKGEKIDITYSNNGNREDIIATLTISMPIRQWRALSREVLSKIDPKCEWKTGNYYAWHFRHQIEEILSVGEKKYIEFYNETKEVREQMIRYAAILD